MTAAPPRSLTSRPVDLFLFVYFILHIPITVCIDSQIVLPASLYPKALIDANQGWIDSANDFLVAGGSKEFDWFYSIVLGELVFQFPFFFYGAYALYKDHVSFRIPGAIYASHVLTTLVPIVGTFLLTDRQTFEQTVLTLSVYGLWVLIPAILLYRTTIGWDHPATIAMEKAYYQKKKTN
ncbi:Transmembrane protein 97 [Blyttiomyces sp. JEL0837]|nr:Transmembrane protein 97 [Blyttiomyces sp. JEL0837]